MRLRLLCSLPRINYEAFPYCENNGVKTPLFLLTYIFLIIPLYTLTCSTIYFGHFFKMISIFCKKSFTYLGFLSSKLIPLLIPSLSFKTKHIRNLQYIVECDNFDHSKTVILGQGAGLRRPLFFSITCFFQSLWRNTNSVIWSWTDYY